MASSAKPNIVLLGIDSLRADHMSCYGYDRLTSRTWTASPNRAPSSKHLQRPYPHHQRLRDHAYRHGRLFNAVGGASP